MTHTADLHTLSLSKTNSCGFVPLCSCGWIGGVHPSWPEHDAKGKRKERNYDEANMRAAAEHRAHVLTDGPLRVTMPLEQFIPTVLRTGRFGHA